MENEDVGSTTAIVIGDSTTGFDGACNSSCVCALVIHCPRRSGKGHFDYLSPPTWQSEFRSCFHGCVAAEQRRPENFSGPLPLREL